MSVEISFTKAEEGMKHAFFDIGTEEIELNDLEITQIDLSPLSSCITLKKVNLGINELQSVDLSPLAYCVNLQILDLGINEIQSIDLIPLGNCINLQELYLNANKLQNIDLNPLKACIDLRIVRLGWNQLQNIDLRPLSVCSKLERLNLEKNQLQSIDLRPLSVCSRLERLNLEKNQLQSIDLTPLSSCIAIQSLCLSGNLFEDIDLAPLGSCTNLSALYLENTGLRSIDLTPLSSCVNLEMLQLDRTEFKYVDVTPVHWIKELYANNAQRISSWLRIDTKAREIDVVYYPPFQIYPWAFLHKVISQFKNDYRVQHDAMLALGLGDYGFIDCDLTEKLLMISPISTTEDAREKIIKLLVEEICKTVDRNGQTIGLNLNQLNRNHIEIATRTKHIVELREAEMENVVVKEDEYGFVLYGLWHTAYGFEILASLDMDQRTDSEGIIRIKKALSELGFELKIGDSSESGVVMSDGLRKCILWIAGNKNCFWDEIMYD
jgi:hypothetical protein